MYICKGPHSHSFLAEQSWFHHHPYRMETSGVCGTLPHRPDFLTYPYGEIGDWLASVLDSSVNEKKKDRVLLGSFFNYILNITPSTLALSSHICHGGEQHTTINFSYRSLIKRINRHRIPQGRTWLPKWSSINTHPLWNYMNFELYCTYFTWPGIKCLSTPRHWAIFKFM